MKVCYECNVAINRKTKNVLCAKCVHEFHLSCANISNDLFVDIEKGVKKWYCSRCQQDQLNATLNDTNSDDNDLNKLKNTMNAFASELKMLKSSSDVFSRDLKLLQDTQTGFSVSLDFLNDKFEKLLTVTKIINDHDHKINNLELDMKSIKSESIFIKNKLDAYEQRDRQLNLLIHGVPYKRNENLQTKLISVADFLEVNTMNQITAVARLSPTQDNQNISSILVKCESIAVKQKMLDGFKVKKTSLSRNINAADLGYIDHPKTVIYVTSHLTSSKQQLLLEAKKLKQLHNYKYVWTKENNIFVKKTDQDKPILIKSLEIIYSLIRQSVLDTAKSS